MGNLGIWKGFLLPISLYVVLRAGFSQFGILAGVYVVLRAGFSQFGNLEGVSIAYFTLYNTRIRVSLYRHTILTSLTSCNIVENRSDG